MTEGTGRCVLPAPDRSEIYMDESRLGIVANPSTMQSERRVAQANGGYSGDADVNSLTLHMLAVPSDPCGGAPKEFVAPGRAVAADNINFFSGTAHRRRKITQ